MKKTDSTIMDCYNKSVIQKIIDKYHFDPMTATRKFWQSETYHLLNEEQFAMWEFSELAIFDMWEVEQLTGNPRNSVYLRSA
ncbi:MAG: hypothetical protein IKX14_02815 [Neisseriaceae bacterium]|nr:hypothetical protein [Neisseriaceae bacterium]